MQSRTPVFLALLLFVLAACATQPTNIAKVERGAMITLLGTDTLALEQFEYTPAALRADAVIRSPQTQLSHYFLQFNQTGGLYRYEATTETPAGETLRREVYEPTPTGDSVQVTLTEGGRTEQRRIARQEPMLPFVEMVHWPFELMLRRADATRQDSLVQTLFTERGLLSFVVRKTGSGEMTVTHPYRGTMEVKVDDDGQLIQLDAGATTRKLTVKRLYNVDVDRFAQHFAAQENAGHPFGPLSGRGTAEATVQGAHLKLDYGQPAKRGREIFGTLVPWNEVWRTGANRATHLATDRTLRFGDLDVPPGEYTLFTIPAPSGGTLIISRQTGQNGNAYDPTHDLGRVPMRIGKLAAPVELFTIQVQETPDGGALHLQWDRAQFTVPFTVTAAN
ncbi:Protein of unknown function [Catalinimonas alkaloidigena]|uniref:DUF2911 domain-containing protein n=1 Tax=Catalinimonas alkaloidigena TaxID=1075417 RepID=A0A1G8ZTG7_9BACT|nr:DUF2911 domain-containing protein [Catalinimonas alkaloidigena]SDK18422.1 Protein of unknown function [Catalinimonas alkaloidigena]